MSNAADSGEGKVEVVVKEEEKSSPSTPTPPPLTPAQRRKRESQEKLREQQALLAEAERQEAAELEAATDASRKEFLLQQVEKTMTGERVAQCTKYLVELVILQNKITASRFTNWDERIQRLETRVGDLGTQRSKILDAIQNLTAQAAPEKFSVALYSAGHKDWRSFGRAALDMEAKLHVQAPSSDRRKGAFPRGGRRGKAAFAYAGSGSASDAGSQPVPSSAASASASAAASVETSVLPSVGTARPASFSYEDPDPDQVPDQSECQSLAAFFFHLKEQKKSKSDLILLRPLINHSRIKGLLDCGATRNFMSPSAVKKLHLGMKVVQLQQPLQVRIGDSTALTIREKVRDIPVTFDSAGEVRHSLNFYIFPDLPFDLVFSMQWLKAVNPRIEWQIPKVELPNSTRVYQPCMIATEHHPNTSCFCLRAKEFYALSRQYDHERMFIALVKQTNATTVSCPPEIQQVVDQYADLMQEPFGLPNRPTKHHIELLPGAVPPKGRIYRMSPTELEELRRQLETLTSKGWIRPNTFEFGAPVLFVPKGSGEFRMCIDYRGFNKITRKSTEPLPRIDDLLDMVQGCIIFSKVDLKSGYHQIEMAEADVYKTAFKTRYGTCEYLVMPFGLCNAPGTFQTEMHRIFRPYLDKFMVVYLDDILVFSKTTREHAEHLTLVLQSLRDSQYKINKEKSSFGVPSVVYLGHVISGDGLAPEAAKIVAIQDWPQPQTMRDVRSFLGLASYYRKFVRNFSAVAAPLTNLTKKDTLFLWSLHCQMAFARLKQALTRAPVLKLSDPTLPFVLTSDASQYGIGAVLQQDDGNGLRPVEFTSKKIKTQKLQDSTYEKELYALFNPNSEPGYAMSSNLLYTYSRGEERLCIPEDQQLRTLLMSECHDARGHFGFLKSYAALSQRFFWKEMRSDMLRYVETCELCQRNKVQRKPPLGLLKPLPIPDRPAQSVSIDFTDLGKTTPRGMRQVMVCVDRFSKYAEFIPLPEVARVPTVRAAFSERWVTHHGPPTSIVSDRDPRFCSDEWQSYCKDYLHSRLDMTSSRHPEANGQAEVMNQILFQLLRPVISPDQQDWDIHLARAQLVYNMFVDSSTGFSPYRLHWGREPRQPLDDIIDKAKTDLTPGTAEFTRRYRLDVERARANLFKAQKAMIEQANRHSRPSPIHTGDYVWVASSELSREEDISPKLLPRYLGPWQVLDTVGADPFGPSYTIDVPLHLRTYPVFHASKLLPFTPADAFPDRPPQWGPPIPGKGYDMEAIEDEWGTCPDRQYLMKFAFQPPTENRWYYRKDLLKTAKSIVLRGGELEFAAKLEAAADDEENYLEDVTRSLAEAYKEDPITMDIINKLQAKDKATSDEFVMVDGLLFLEKAGFRSLVVPSREILCSLFLGECRHATGHFGYKKTSANLVQRFWWPNMLEDVKKYVETYQVYQRDKSRTQAPLGLLKPLPIPAGPEQSISMNFMDTLVTSKNGKRHIFVIVDRFTKYARLIAMPETARTEHVIKLFMDNWVRDFGLPKTIVSDRDVRFTSEMWKKAPEQVGSQLQMTSGSHPEANGQAEQMNRVVQHLLRHYIKPNPDDWDEKLPLIARLYNNDVRSTIGVSPNQLHLGWKPKSALDFLLPENRIVSTPETIEFGVQYEKLLQWTVEHIKKSQEAMIASENTRRRQTTFQVGERVWVKASELGQELGISRKLMPQYFGPWEVLDIVGNDLDGPSCVICIPGHLRTYPVFHSSKLAPFAWSLRSMMPPTMDGQVDIDDIVDHIDLPVPKPLGRGRPPKPKREYCVRFRHHTHPKEDRWFTREELIDTAPQVVAEYERMLKGKAPAK
ncbi:hypothetical protein CBR_g21071 [Chara braunii]|uniref:Reverse transcriptase n=1 Tax=Chara braunii TaxID=69332 RepID=A0A388L0I2_CHABU|nr:hypothetical protein CBR_g21071 [Chara braunii]|eukprot:GBG75826.1 hypothetical protein CBR_g21071 [Chara braunii]